MSIITLPLNTLQEWLHQEYTSKNNPFEGTFISDLDFSKDEDGEYIDNISYYATETSNWDIINNEYFTFDKGKEEFYINKTNPHIIFNQITEFSNWVTRSYEDELFPWENNAWDEGYCSGDDDVDYNSSYLDTLVEALTIYLNSKQLL